MRAQTTDGSTVILGSILVEDNAAGVVRVSVAGFDKTNGLAVTGAKIARYKKVNGTLTLGTPANDLATETDSALNGATFALVAASNNINVTVTGDAGNTINWVGAAQLMVQVDY